MCGKSLKKTVIALGMIFTIGVIMILVATQYGIMTASRIIDRQGGNLDLNYYYLIVKSNALSFQIIGTILSTISGVGALLCYRDYGENKYQTLV